jgi:hypothetical protein
MKQNASEIFAISSARYSSAATDFISNAATDRQLFTLLLRSGDTIAPGLPVGARRQVKSCRLEINQA